MKRVAAGAVAPERLVLTLRNRDGATLAERLDFGTVTAASIRVLDSDTRWTATILSAASDELTIAHPFGALDVPRRALLRLSVELATPGGLRRSAPIPLEVT